ncbi:2-polyprenyl-6-methoxyphenol hydroxylase-like FAD-dependent oxidoreductase [Nocardia pseudobrasiliensis]|uniref:2-polyprenyl-6-methoxyphenol hydroxylase-like FAD-dependent oxidoreductase n=2 Tax=Nocardia pseudobrasiliensis TaxID=45979 RepID=A0A370I8C1_9NOCA|nr:2-polyprenyl-6-methoxyphenol hydroxylase-like FAD-dependent oxidoreductase [Nocardia pseudobrasiliensis]
MMAGLLLARAGIRVTVLEKHTDFLRDFRGDTVHPSTLRLLDELGLAQRFAALPHTKLERRSLRINEKTVLAADFGRIPGPYRYMAMVPQWEFLDLLARAAADEPTFTLRLGTEFTDLVSDSGRVTGVRCRDADGAERILTADLVLACDGRGSAARAAAGLRPREMDVPMDVWWVRVPVAADDRHNRAVSGRFEAGRAAVCMDRGDYYQTSFLIPKGADARLRGNEIQWLRTHLAELFGWGEDVLAAIGGWGDVKLLEVTMGRLSRWHVPGLLCLGDAAHPMSPVGGVGVNLAIQDAVAAARLLAEPLRRGRPGVADLERVQRRRTLPTAFTQRIQQREHETLLAPALDGTLSKTPSHLALIDRFPVLAGVAAYLGGVGIRPERAPSFARR